MHKFLSQSHKFVCQSRTRNLFEYNVATTRSLLVAPTTSPCLHTALCQSDKTRAHFILECLLIHQPPHAVCM